MNEAESSKLFGLSREMEICKQEFWFFKHIFKNETVFSYFLRMDSGSEKSKRCGLF